MQCPNCEAENRDEAKFCDECGFPLSGAIARVAGGASPIWRDPDDALPFEEDVEEFQHPALREEAGLASVAPDLADEAQAHDRHWGFGASERDEAQDPGSTMRLPVDEEASESEDEKLDAAEDAGSADSNAEDDESSQGDGEPYGKPDDYETEGDYPDEEPDAHVGDYGGSWDSQQSSWPSDFTMQMPVIDDDAPKYRDFMASSSKAQDHRKRNVAIAIGIIAAIVVIGVVAGFALGLIGGKVIPNVVGMTESDARNILAEEGFAVRSTQVKSDETEGLVLLMDPGAGSHASEGSEVVIHVATARFIPDIVGKGYDEAMQALTEAGYENIRVEKQKSAGEENVVLSVTPDAGTRAKSSIEVVMNVSEGYHVPDISSLDLEAAIEAIEQEGLTAQVIYIDTDQYVSGTIMGTEPAAGTKVLEGDYVSINVARTRGIELENLTSSLLAAGNEVMVGGTLVDIESLDSVSYEGDDVVSFTLTGRPKTSLLGETVYGTTRAVSGQVAWSADNEVLSIS